MLLHFSSKEREFMSILPGHFCQGNILIGYSLIILGNLIVVLWLSNRWSANSRESSAPVCRGSVKAFPPAGWCALLKREAPWFANAGIWWITFGCLRRSLVLLKLIMMTRFYYRSLELFGGSFWSFTIVLDLKISIKMWVSAWKSVALLKQIRRLNHVQF